jgi:hypothetical protein
MIRSAEHTLAIIRVPVVPRMAMLLQLIEGKIAVRFLESGPHSNWIYYRKMLINYATKFSSRGKMARLSLESSSSSPRTWRHPWAVRTGISGTCLWTAARGRGRPGGKDETWLQHCRGVKNNDTKRNPRTQNPPNKNLVKDVVARQLRKGIGRLEVLRAHHTLFFQKRLSRASATSSQLRQALL